MKNILFNLIIGAVIALAIFSSVTTINYLREDKVLLASHCPTTYEACRQATENWCWQLVGDESVGCCIKNTENSTCNSDQCLEMYCW
ncbi:MAG: hypothetical protein HRU80_09590 [Ignavibacteriales bacterium]|nr:MAG: hypothetical protein HRU80_09590 [Ignavibacteriales bacterium]